jgi:hypothetical protein
LDVPYSAFVLARNEAVQQPILDCGEPNPTLTQAGDFAPGPNLLHNACPGSPKVIMIGYLAAISQVPKG